MINNSQITMGPIVPTSPQASGPGGNPIVPNPASPGDFPKMLIAIAVGAGFIWVLSTFNDQYATWLAMLSLLGIVTYYETHGNNQFSNGLKDLTGAIGW